MEYMTYFLVVGALAALRGLAKYDEGKNAARQVQLNAEQTRHLTGIRNNILPQILNGREFSQEFVTTLAEYTTAIVQWRAIQRLEKRCKNNILIPLFRTESGFVSLFDSQLEVLKNFFADPDILVIAPRNYTSGVPMSIPSLYQSQCWLGETIDWKLGLPTRLDDKVGDKSTKIWEGFLQSSSAHIDATKRLSAWDELRHNNDSDAKSEAKMYDLLMTRNGAYRVDFDWNSPFRAGNLYDYPRFSDEVNETLLPTVVERFYVSVNFNSEESAASFRKLACLYGEIEMAEASALAQVHLLEEQLSEAGISTEDLGEFSARVSIFYGSCAADPVLENKRKISEALRERKLPSPSEMAVGLGFTKPTAFVIQKIASEMRSIISTKYSEWMAETLHTLKTTVEKMSLSTDTVEKISLSTDNDPEINAKIK